MKHNKLCLGTVQFGMNYGINNKEGQPLKNDVFNMLDTAINERIQYIDTAAAYGDAEEILGEYFRSRKVGNNIKVISKLKPNIFNETNRSTEEVIEEEVRKSLDKININFLDGYLLHTPSYFYNKEIINGLLKVKEMGLVKNIGVSIYETQHALDVVSSGKVDYIQIPYSVFDQRLDNTDFFEIAKKNNVTVYGRSAFLQGLILMNSNEIPEHLKVAVKYLEIFDKIISDFGFTRAEAAFRFSYEHPGIDYVAFGVDSIKQLEEDISFIYIKDNFDECKNKLKQQLKNIEESIIFPSLWTKNK